MLTPDVRVEEFDASDWIALGETFGRKSENGAPAGGLAIVTEGARVVKLLSTRNGKLDKAALTADASLAELAGQHGARWAVRLDRRALPLLADRFSRQVERTDNLLAQSIKFGKVVRELAAEGLVETFPRDVRALRVPSEPVVKRALDALCPIGKTALIGVFEGPRVVTAIAVHRSERGIDRIVGPATARGEMGLISGDWARDARGLSRAFELGVGPLSVGCFAEQSTFQRLMGDTTPGAWAAAVASRHVVFHPASPTLAIPLGVDVGRAAVVVARDLAARLGVSAWLGPASPLRPALDKLREASRGEIDKLRSAGAALDPLSLLRELFDGNRESH